MNKLKSFIRLCLAQNVGVKKLKALLKYFGSVENICSSTPRKIAEVPGIGKNTAENILGVSREDIEKEYELSIREGLQLISLEDDKYPENLNSVYSPPLLLYVQGTLKKKDKVAISIVGSRNATYYGLSVAERLAYGLASHGITVVSGMARGIDTAAHKGALKAGGRTIAVLGNGLFNIYPRENKELSQKISESGALITELPLNTPPYKQNFPKRNRIISGLSLGVIVVEAANRSGALITADFALDQGKEVFAVPGKIDSKTSKGPHKLIQQGAKLVHTLEDVLVELNIEIYKDNKRKRGLNFNNLDEEEKKVFSFIEKEPQHIDRIVEKSKISLNSLLSTLMKLQMKGFVKETAGKKFVRN